ncbi:hypothetical protein ACSW8S_17470 (plasmid) [Clostridium perfringens]|nr:hypothetical protein [Clostridium perfringens]MDM0976825.1 hypothetical protein [Clostridium perfringens]
MDKEDSLDKVKMFLKKYEIGNIDTIKEQTKNHLLNIESYFQKCESNYNEILEKQKSINLSTRGICENSGVSKSTIYNNADILKKYIDSRLLDIECNIEIVSKIQLESIKRENCELKNIIDNILINKIQFMNFKNENIKLKKQLESLGKKLDSYKEDRRQLINRINKIEKTMYNKDNIVVLDKDYNNKPH